MDHARQSVTDPEFIQDPYRFYEFIRSDGLISWDAYAMPMVTSHRLVAALLRDRRFGRENPMPAPIPPRLQPFYDIEAHSMLELEPPRHTRLRGLVLRAFTSRRIKALEPEIAQLAHDLIDRFPDGPFDLLPAFAQTLPVVVIARLLGVPEGRAPDLLAWSSAMVGMYHAARSRAKEDAAIAATHAFTAFLAEHMADRRRAPRDDLISHLIAAEEDGTHLSSEELITTCILLLNAGHEATVHTIGNAVKLALETGQRPDSRDAYTEEVLRFAPPLHIFTRYALEEVEVAGHRFQTGEQVGLILAAANRDPAAYADPGRFNPQRPLKPAHTAFGGGIHFCVGAPLARLELTCALEILFDRCPDLRLAAPPRFAPIYHFHGLSELRVTK